MKFWIIISLLFSLINNHAQEISLAELRDLYVEASFEEDKAKKLYKLTKNSSIESDYKKFTYYAIAILLNSKFSMNPIDKIKLFGEGKQRLEKVISQYPKDIELRFLRFCVQYGTPTILDYKLNMEEDSQFINNNISKSSKELQQFIMPIFKLLNDDRTSYIGR
ncbi:MAG: hypothetical protein VXZ76_03660 [Bacteroidota bacterium]|nr:hypothetical protein [Bacteroidota bacterium]